MTVPTQFVRAAGIRFAYRRLGAQSGTPLLFLQHYRGNMDDWDPAVVEGLAAHRPVILLDYRGIGRSSGTTSDNIAAMGRDVIAFVEALGLKQIDLLGFSLGGMVAQQALFERPALVRRAILAGTGPLGAVDMFREEVMAAATRTPFGAEEMLFLFFEPTQTSQAAGRRFIQRMMARTDRAPPATARVIRAHLAAIHGWAAAGDQPARLMAVEHPVLVVNGRHDMLIPTVNAFVLSQYLPNAHLILYPDAGHGCMFQYPEWFVDDASRFLDRR